MSPDEIFVTVAAAFVGPVLWAGRIFSLSRLVTFRPGRPLGHLTILVAVLSLSVYGTLRWFAADDVRQAPAYLLQYTLLGVAWLKIGESAAAFFGLGARSALVESGNQAAWPALTGVLVGVAACYAGGNIGNGPGWWVVVYSAALATAMLFGLWVAVDAVSGITEAVAVGRDIPSGVRLGGFLAASGLVLGRSVAGDWVSTAATTTDALVTAWPLAIGVGVAALVEGRLRPTLERPSPPAQAGLGPALIYLGAAIAYIWTLGWPA
jgi:hypothetical protein